MNKLLVIAGPCVIESEENVMQMAIKEPSPDLLLGWTYKTELEDGIRLAYEDFLNNPMRAER